MFRLFRDYLSTKRIFFFSWIIITRLLVQKISQTSFFFVLLTTENKKATMPSPFIKYIQNEQHYTEVISRVATVKHSLWIGTADIKDLYVMKGKEAVPFLSSLAELLKKGVDVRLIHAKEPGQMFRDDFDKYPILSTDLERVCCPRVHFKLMIFDTETAYIGSANLTGAGMGMKSENRRNFEAGILTNDPEFVESAINQFDNVWMGAYCKNCGRKDVCIDRIG